MLKKSENNGTEEIGLVTPTPGNTIVNMVGWIINLADLTCMQKFNAVALIFQTPLCNCDAIGLTDLSWR